MKKMNVTFKSLLGFAFVLAFMVFGTMNSNAQNELVSASSNISLDAAVGTPGGTSVINTLQGATFVGASEAKQILADAYLALDNDLNSDDDLIQNTAYVTGNFYRTIITNINQTSDVETSVLYAYVVLVDQVSSNPFSDFINAQNIAEDTIDMLSN